MIGMTDLFQVLSSYRRFMKDFALKISIDVILRGRKSVGGYKTDSFVR